MLPDDVRECPNCGNPIRHSDYDCSCGWRDRDGWTPADYVRENVEFLTEHIDHRRTTAYRSALQSLLQQVPTLLDALSWYADEDNYDDFCPGVVETDGHGGWVLIEDDGKRARAALAALEQDGEG